MAELEIKTSVVLDRFKSVESAMKYINSIEVFVGISEEDSNRQPELQNEITNAQLMFIHSNGSPINNIPKRPVIEPAISYGKDDISKIMSKAIEFALEGQNELAAKKMEEAGVKGVNLSRGWFVNPENGWPPNSPSVVRRKKKKGANNPRPLIDTSQLRNSIHYFVKRKAQ